MLLNIIVEENAFWQPFRTLLRPDFVRINVFTEALTAIIVTDEDDYEYFRGPFVVVVRSRKHQFQYCAEDNIFSTIAVCFINAWDFDESRRPTKHYAIFIIIITCIIIINRHAVLITVFEKTTERHDFTRELFSVNFFQNVLSFSSFPFGKICPLSFNFLFRLLSVRIKISMYNIHYNERLEIKWDP